MPKTILTSGEVYELILENKYKINPETKFISRCIDGRYQNDKNLPALAIPGADVGDLAVLVASGNHYGFDVDIEKSFDILIDTVGGVKNIRGHTDSHTDPKILLGGCGHVKHKTTDPDAYNLTRENAQDILKIFADAKKKGAQEVVLVGEHMEGAVLIVTGNFGIYPQYRFKRLGGDIAAQVFIVQQTLVDARHKVWAKKLVETGAVKLFEGCDEEYLYQVMSEVGETHLMETASRLAKGLPIFSVKFKEDATFELEEVGKVGE